MNQSRRKTWIAILLFLVIALTGLSFCAWPLEFFGVFNQLRMFLIGAHSEFTTVDGYRVHYYVLGPANGQPAVLVHGLGGRAEDWVKLAPYLAKAGHRVYLPDLPGYGESERPANFSYSVGDQADVVLGFFDVLGLKQVDLGGWSMGGWIVQLMAARHPERVKRLMLFDSAGLHVHPEWDTQLFTPVSALQIEKLDKLLMPNPPHVPDFVATAILRYSRKHAWVMHRAIDSMLLGRETTDNLLPDIKMPVLLVWGKVDQIIPLSQGEKMHQLLPNSKLDVVPGCGHLAPNECAGQIGPEVVNFLRH
jgi:pimeloyl-ACP methyl ester carboxylesterase